MKKAILLVALFLVGTATQTLANHQNNVDRNLHKNYDCNHTNTIQFVEEGVLYTITAQGSFEYEILRNRFAYRTYGKLGKFQKRKFKHLQRRNFRPFITKDRLGRIRSINNTFITYKRNGKVKTIGSIPIYYKRGRLVQVGNMELVYNRFGALRHTNGHVNRFNKKFWHDDWYVYNDRNNNDFEEEYFGRRKKDK